MQKDFTLKRRLARRVKEAGAIVQAHRHGIVIHLPKGTINQKHLAKAFPMFRNSMLPLSLRAQPTRRGFVFDLKRCLPAILERYGGWQGLAKHEKAVAERAAAVAEKRKSAQAERTAYLSAHIASSSFLEATSLADWRRSLEARGMEPPEANEDLRAFLGPGLTAPSNSRARAAVNAHEQLQRAVGARRTRLVEELIKLGVEGCGKHYLFLDFCHHGDYSQAAVVARRLARETYLNLHADDMAQAVEQRAVEMAEGYGVPPSQLLACAEREVRANWPMPDTWPGL